MAATRLVSSAADIWASFDFIPKDSSRETYSSSSFLPQVALRSHLDLLTQERWQWRGSILMSCALAPPWSVDMGERNNPADTMRAIAPRLERSPLDAKMR